MADELALEAVYYPGPVPLFPQTLTFMGLVFDRIHFPHVHLPTDGYDADATAEEAKRIESIVRPGNLDDIYLLNALSFLPYVKTLEGFCYFASAPEQAFGSVDERSNDIVKVLDEVIHGPPREGFIPIHSTGHNKGLVGGESIDYPGLLHYPSNALLYAAKHNLPVINDLHFMPVPAIGGQDAKNNAKLLSTILAVQCGSIALPKVRALHPAEIMEVRADLQPHLQPFRIAIRRLAANLNSAISNDSDSEDVIQAANFVIETEVVPAMQEVKALLEAPQRKLLDRAWDAAKKVPELGAAYTSCGATGAGLKLIEILGDFLIDVRAQRDAREAARSSYYYLLRAGDLTKKK